MDGSVQKDEQGDIVELVTPFGTFHEGDRYGGSLIQWRNEGMLGGIPGEWNFGFTAQTGEEFEFFQFSPSMTFLNYNENGELQRVDAGD